MPKLIGFTGFAGFGVLARDLHDLGLKFSLFSFGSRLSGV